MEFGVLGTVEARHAGRELPLGGARQRRLLATLLLNRAKSVSVEHLEEELWADPPATARQQVHNAVAALRRALRVHPEVFEIQTTDAGYLALFDPARLDLNRFRGLVSEARTAEEEGRIKGAVDLLSEADRLWRGPALAVPQGRYLERMAGRLNDERLDASHRRFALRLSVEDAGVVVGELTDLVIENPLHDPLRALLVIAYFRTGKAVGALDVYEEGRRLLADELGIDPSAQLQSVHRSVLLGADPGHMVGVGQPKMESTATVDEAGTGGASPRGTPYCSLPFVIEDFTGRADELRQAAEVANPSGVSVCVIEGLGGIGKTAFATSLARRLVDRYPDGQYFLDLHGFTSREEPVAPAMALGILLRAIGVPHDRIPPTLDARIGLWRAETAGRRLLLVLDNVVDEAQVRPLMPGLSNTFVLVTSRRRLVELDTSLSITLKALPDDEAAALFRSIAGPARTVDEDDLLSEVLELCGHLPLAVRLAASRFRARPSWTVADLAEVLRDSARRAQVLSVEGRSMAEVLGFSYRYLDAARRRVFRLLSLIPGGDFDSATAASLLDQPIDLLVGHLERLLEDNLLVSFAADRYGYHDLLRDFARTLVAREDGDEVVSAAEHRLLRYYEDVVERCTAFIDRSTPTPRPAAVSPEMPVIASAAEATAWLEHEYRNLSAAARYALATDHRSYSWRLACAIDPFLVLQNRREDWRDVFGEALPAVREEGDRSAEATLLAALGVMDRDRGAHEDGKRLLLAAATISREIGDKPGEALRIAGVGIVELRSGHLRGAYDNFMEARRLSLEAGDARSYAAFTSNLSVICLEFGRAEEAAALAGEALDVFRRASHPQAASLAGTNMGRALLKQGRYDEAIGYLKDALSLSRRTTYRNGHAYAAAWLAMATKFIGPVQEGLRYGEEARLVAREYAVRDVECEALLALGWLYRSMGEQASAERNFEAAIDIAGQDNLQVHQAWAEDGLAHLAVAGGQREAAREHWTRALALHSPEGADAEATRSHVDTLEDASTVTCWRCRSPAV